MTPRETRRKAARQTAVVTVDEEGVSFLLPVVPLRKCLRELRKTIPRKLQGGVRFRVREASVTVDAVEAKNQRVFHEVVIPAVVSPEALERCPPIVLEAWRLERLCAVPDIGDWLRLHHDPVPGQREWAAALWPLVLRRLRGGDTFLFAVGVVESVTGKKIRTTIQAVETDALAEGAFRGALATNADAYVGLATVTAGVATLEVLQDSGGVRMAGPLGSDARPRVWWQADMVRPRRGAESAPLSPLDDDYVRPSQS